MHNLLPMKINRLIIDMDQLYNNQQVYCNDSRLLDLRSIFI